MSESRKWLMVRLGIASYFLVAVTALVTEMVAG